MTARTTLSKKETRLVRAMQLLGDDTRFKIFKLLSSEEELCVSDIAHRLSISPSAVSQHFRNFELLGIVEKERMGQKICYSLREEDSLVSELIKVTER
ncbi:MAG: DNA-binding transcriptional ArsR family regulator [Candidatus Saccharimonadales bacterium]|jgi:DNA-binding transcriptional ArsR family regulator